MVRWITGIAVLGAAASMAACSSSTGGGTATPTPATSSSASTSSSTSSASAVATTVDPCQLVTSSEASSLTGASFGSGSEETTSGGGKLCVYGGQTLNVFEVLVGQASDAATAQSQFSAYESQAQSMLQKGASSSFPVNFSVNDTSVSGADKAATGVFSASIAGHTIGGSAVYLLKGVNFVAISDLTLGGSVPSQSAMATQAQTTVSRLP